MKLNFWGAMQLRMSCVLMLSVCLHACAPLKPLQFRSVSDFSVKHVLTQPEAAVTLNLYNPNSIGGKLKEVNVQFSISNVVLSNIQIDQVTRVPAKGEFAIPITGITSVSELLKFLPAGINTLFAGKDLPVSITGNVTVKKFIFMKVFPFEVREQINSNDIRIK